MKEDIHCYKFILYLIKIESIVCHNVQRFVDR